MPQHGYRPTEVPGYMGDWLDKARILPPTVAPPAPTRPYGPPSLLPSAPPVSSGIGGWSTEGLGPIRAEPAAQALGPIPSPDLPTRQTPNIVAGYGTRGAAARSPSTLWELVKRLLAAQEPTAAQPPVQYPPVRVPQMTNPSGDGVMVSQMDER